MWNKTHKWEIFLAFADVPCRSPDFKTGGIATTNCVFQSDNITDWMQARSVHLYPATESQRNTTLCQLCWLSDT